MMRLILAILAVLLWVFAASGVSDPRTDVLGLYFDENANQTCLDGLLPGVPFSIYLIYTNPSVPEILGFEVGYHQTGTLFELPFLWPCGLIWTVEPDLDNLFVACSEPFLTSPANILVQFDYMWLGGSPPEATFYVEKASGSAQPGNKPHIILPDGSLMEVEPGYVAFTMDFCGVPADALEWGAIKSLYH